MDFSNGQFLPSPTMSTGLLERTFFLSGSLRKETHGHALLHVTAVATTIADLVEGLSTSGSRVSSSKVLGERAEKSVETWCKEVLSRSLCFSDYL